MNLLGRWFTHDQNEEVSGLLSAIEHAVNRVEPQLKLAGGYPNAYRKAVKNALEYARSLALSIPGPIEISLDSYARDAYVHAIFPSMENVSEAFRTSQVMQEYLRQYHTNDEVYALMGMRRYEKNILGMELSGDIIQHDVPQHAVYFISHTFASPAPNEMPAREQMTWMFFDKLLDKVAGRIASRKQEMQSLRLKLDSLSADLHTANPEARPVLEAKLSEILTGMSSLARSLDLNNYPADFEAVLLNPEKYLHLNQSPMILDSMGIKRDSDGTARGEKIIFNDLIGFDRRDWTVIIVHCRNIQSETFAARLEAAYRTLSI